MDNSNGNMAFRAPKWARPGIIIPIAVVLAALALEQQGHFQGHGDIDDLGQFFRITSYNVCYTKLLRIKKQSE